MEIAKILSLASFYKMGSIPCLSTFLSLFHSFCVSLGCRKYGYYLSAGLICVNLLLYPQSLLPDNFIDRPTALSAAVAINLGTITNIANTLLAHFHPIILEQYNPKKDETGLFGCVPIVRRASHHQIIINHFSVAVDAIPGRI